MSVKKYQKPKRKGQRKGSVARLKNNKERNDAKNKIRGGRYDDIT